MTHSLKEVIDTLQKIAAEMPDKQVACFYSEEGEAENPSGLARGFACETAETPKCIIGHLVHRLDGVEGLRKLVENYGVDDQPETFIELGYSEEALIYMARVQGLHDDGDTFEGAVMEACKGA